MVSKKTLLIIFSTLICLFWSSCGTLFFSQVDCREFENNKDLVWYPGIKGDTIRFMKSDNSLVKFIIADKFITHTTSYISDTGCSCLDIWGISLSNGSDSIHYWGGSNYIYDQDQKRYDRIFIEINGVKSGFTNEISRTISDTIIDKINYKEVRKFKRDLLNENDFITIYTAKSIGIIKMEKSNGEIWINSNLNENQNFDFESFNYIERKDE